MSDLNEITKALEASNRAFEEFKRINDEKSSKTEAERKEAMEKAFAEMRAMKETVETLEAKMRRPNLGNGEQVDEVAQQHKSAFNQYMRKGTDFDLALEQKALNIGSGTDGGYAVPKVIDGMIEELIVNVSPIREIATVQQIGTSDFHKLVNKRGTSSGWVGEAESRSETNTPQMADVAPPMGELYANPMATQQMLDDVFFNAESWLAENIALEFARAEGAAFISGTGVKQPLGILSGTPVATADSTRTFGVLEYVPTGKSADFIGVTGTTGPADVLFNTVSKLKKGYRQGSVWVMNKGTLFAAMKLKDSYGRYIFNPSTAPGVADTILGYSVYEAEDMPDIAANSFSIAFGNFKRGYLIVDRVGTRVIRDPFSNKPYIGFYTTKRVGGGIVNSEAIKLIKFAAS